MILWLRLAAATAVLLAPGWAVARALGRRTAAAVLVWSCTLVAGALALTFAVGGSIDLALGLVLGAGAVALPFGLRRRAEPSDLPVRGAIVLAGVVLGALLWGIEGVVHGDALFHLGRIRKLDDFGALSLRAVDEFKDGGLHPGYAFPLWHGWLALVARVAQVDPASVVLHEPSILTPLALVLAYEAGKSVFRSTSLGLAAMAAQVAVIALAPGNGGSYTSLELPGTVARQLLVPAVITLFFAFVRGPSWALALTLAAAGMDLAFVHPTYALFVALPLAGFALARLPTGGDARRSIGGLAAFGLPVVLVFAWLEPLVAETRSHNPSAAEKAAQLKHYAGDLVVHSPSSFHLGAGLVARTGSIAIAGLILVPLAVLAGRRRWSAFVLGGSVLVLVLELWSLVFPHFSDFVSLSQSRRAAGFVPFPFALVGGAAIGSRVLKLLVLPAALAGGIVLQLQYPFDSRPVLPAWFALFGGLAALAVLLVRRGLEVERAGPVAALAVALFVLPVVVHGFSHWHTAVPRDPGALTPGLVRYLRNDVPQRAVVFADLETSYRISAYASVYVAAAPPAHVADTKANRPAARRADVIAFLRTGDLAIPRRYHADWLVLRRGERAQPGGRLVYRDALFRVLRI